MYVSSVNNISDWGPQWGVRNAIPVSNLHHSCLCCRPYHARSNRHDMGMVQAVRFIHEVLPWRMTSPLISHSIIMTPKRIHMPIQSNITDVRVKIACTARSWSNQLSNLGHNKNSPLWPYIQWLWILEPEITVIQHHTSAGITLYHLMWIIWRLQTNYRAEKTEMCATGVQECLTQERKNTRAVLHLKKIWLCQTSSPPTPLSAAGGQNTWHCANRRLLSSRFRIFI